MSAEFSTIAFQLQAGPSIAITSSSIGKHRRVALHTVLQNISLFKKR